MKYWVNGFYITKQLMAYRHIFFFGLLFIALCEAGTNNITSIGEYATSSFTWAVGIRNLTFHIFCNDDDFYGWVYSTRRVASVLTNFTCESQVPGYDIICSHFTSNLTILNPPMYKNTSLLEVIDCSEIDNIKAEISIRYCPDFLDVRQRFLNILPHTNEFKFMSKVTYKCNDSSSLIVDSDFSVQHDSYIRICQFDATWNGSDAVICSYAPTSNISVENATSTFQASGNIIFQCEVIDPGNPNATFINYHIYYENSTNNMRTLMLNEKLILPSTPDLNNANVSCQGRNNFTVDIDPSVGISEPITLNILFGPISNSVFEVVQGVVGQSVDIVFSFKANPEISEGNLKLTFSANNAGANVTLETGNGTLTGNSPQTYTYRIKKIKTEDLGLYYLTVSSPQKDLNSLILIRNLTGEVRAMTTAINFESTTFSGITTDVPAQSNTIIYAVAGSVAGFLIILLIILIVHILLRRRREKGIGANEQRVNPVYEASSTDGNNDKEERINPIYGSSGPANNEKEERFNPLYGNADDESTKENKVMKKGKVKKSEKEERQNPLYASSTVRNDVVEDAYAEIEKSKKKENVGQTPVFAVESVSGDTYAEVKKPKSMPGMSQPDATYAEVKKDKQGKKVGNLHGTTEEAP